MADDYLHGLRQEQYQQEYEEEEESDEEDYEEEENEEDAENDSRGNNIQQKDGIKGNLYGDYADADSHKNIIVDEDYEEYD